MKMRRVVIEGASTAYGWYDHERNGWASRLVLEVMPYDPPLMEEVVFIQNHAVPGHTLTAINRKVAHDIDGYRHAALTTVLSVGMNEAKIHLGETQPKLSLADFAIQLAQYSEIVARRGGSTVFVGPQPIAEPVIYYDQIAASFDCNLIHDYASVIEARALRAGMPYVDTFALYEGHDLNMVLDKDQLHPSALGHMMLHG